MDFVDDLGLIDRDIKLFRENKSKYWMEKLSKDNTRMFVNAQLKGKSETSQEDQNVNPVQYDAMNTEFHGVPERELLLVQPQKGKSRRAVLTPAPSAPERDLVSLTRKISLDGPSAGPVYTSSLENKKSRGLSLLKHSSKNTNSFLSLGLGDPSKIPLKLHGPIHSNSYKKSSSGKNAFHLDRTPVALGSRFPSKDKMGFFDENNLDEEKLFGMYEVSDDDFKSLK